MDVFEEHKINLIEQLSKASLEIEKNIKWSSVTRLNIPKYIVDTYYKETGVSIDEDKIMKMEDINFRKWVNRKFLRGNRCLRMEKGI